MGSIVNRGASFRAVVRTNGFTKTQTFATKKEANAWITTTEAGLSSAPRLKRGNTLGFVFAKAHAAEMAKPYNSSGAGKLFEQLGREVGDVDLKDCTVEWWRTWILGWQYKGKGTQGYSRLTKLRRIRGALSAAEELHDIKIDWDALRLATKKLTRAKVLKKYKARARRVTDAEIRMLKAASNDKSKLPYGDLIDFAVFTCLRAGEIFRITWDDLNTDSGNPMLWVRDRKHPTEKMGNDQNIPLLGNAAAIIKRQPRKRLADGSLDPRIFPFKADGFVNAFIRLRNRAKLPDVHFHDLRHEGISRLFEAGYGIAEVTGVSGHQSWECLKVYTNLKAADMHKGPIAHRRAA
jgi:integrase